MPKGHRHYGARGESKPENVVTLAVEPRQANLFRQWLRAAEGRMLNVSGRYYGMNDGESDEVQKVINRLYVVMGG